LIGIVKKNAIMMIDFALGGRTDRWVEPGRVDLSGGGFALSPDHDDDHAALLGAIPLALDKAPAPKSGNRSDTPSSAAYCCRNS